VPTPLPVAPVPQNQNEGKNELNAGQNQNTAPPDTAAVAVSDTREELESGVLSVIFRFAFLCVLLFGGGWREVLSVSPRVGAGSCEERRGGSYSHGDVDPTRAPLSMSVFVSVGGGRERAARLDGVRDAVPSTCNSTVTAI
jgi:hypothetical protein